MFNPTASRWIMAPAPLTNTLSPLASPLSTIVSVSLLLATMPSVLSAEIWVELRERKPAVVMAIVISTLAGLLPAWRAAKLKAVEALRSE